MSSGFWLALAIYLWGGLWSGMCAFTAEGEGSNAARVVTFFVALLFWVFILPFACRVNTKTGELN